MIIGLVLAGLGVLFLPSCESGLIQIDGSNNGLYFEARNKNGSYWFDFRPKDL